MAPGESTPPPSSAPAAGWYPDPDQPGQQRYWDGGAWTDHRAPLAPAPTPKTGGGHTVLKVAAGVVLGFVALIAGCSALLGSAADEITEEAQEHAISRAQYESIADGTSRAAVEAELGSPDSDQDFQTGGLPDSQCIYYNETGADWAEGSYFQFCFDGDRLSSKSAY